MGLGIELPHEQGMNEWGDLGVRFRYFFVRRTMCVEHASGHVALPGGFGTLDDLLEAVTLAQTQQVTRFPVVLLGREFWSPLIDWLREHLLAEGMVAAADIDRLLIADTAEEAVRLVLSDPVD